MSASFRNLLESRCSANYFDQDRPVSDDMIVELARLATLAPSAYHMQNWKFIAVRTPAAKAQLKAAAYGQQKVEDASVTFVMCGTLTGHETLRESLAPVVAAGLMAEDDAAGWASAATRSLHRNPQLQRDEAFRSASLAAMTLILAAADMGLSSSAMSGFDAAGVARQCQLSDKDIPVMLIAVGYPASGNWPQKPRLPVQRVLQLL